MRLRIAFPIVAIIVLIGFFAARIQRNKHIQDEEVPVIGEPHVEL